MPDTKFSPAKLKEHLRKSFWIYAVVIVACLAATNLLWTTTAPRVPSNQSILIFLADAYSNPTALDDVAADALEKLEADTDIRAFEFQSLQYADPETDYTGSMLLMTRMAVAEGDAFFCNRWCMESLVKSDGLLPLDDFVAAGWLEAYDLEPYTATRVDAESGAETTCVAGLHLDSVTALSERGAFDNNGAFLCLPSYCDNVDETLEAIEIILSDLTEAKDD